jgi:hypothetical protein
MKMEYLKLNVKQNWCFIYEYSRTTFMEGRIYTYDGNVSGVQCPTLELQQHTGASDIKLRVS